MLILLFSLIIYIFILGTINTEEDPRKPDDEWEKKRREIRKLTKELRKNANPKKTKKIRRIYLEPVDERYEYTP